MAIIGLQKREQWLCDNISNSTVSIGDLPNIPPIPKGQNVDLLRYYHKTDISQSNSLKILISRNFVKISKVKNNVKTEFLGKDAHKAITGAEENEISGGGDISDIYLSDIVDVTISQPTNGQTIVFHNGIWTNSTSSSTISLGDIENVNISNPTNNQSLVFNESSGIWENQTLTYNLEDLTNIDINDPYNGYVLAYNTELSKYTLTDNVLSSKELSNGANIVTVEELRTFLDGQYGSSYLISGGVPVWTGGLSFLVSTAYYSIQGEQFHSLETAITLESADSTYSRIDVIVVNTDGEVVAITGTPAAEPFKPDIDVSTQLELTFVTVNANSEVPEDITSDMIYTAESLPSDWSFYTENNLIDGKSNQDAYQGSFSIRLNKAWARSGAWQTRGFSLTSPTSVNIENATSLNMMSKIFGSGFTSYLTIELYNNSNIVGSGVKLQPGNFGLANIQDEWSIVTIPISSFNPNDTEVTEIRCTFPGSSDSNRSVSCYIDNVQIQGGVPSSSVPPKTFSIRSIIADSGVIVADISEDTIYISGGTNISTSVSDKELTIDFTGSTGISSLSEDNSPQLSANLNSSNNTIYGIKTATFNSEYSVIPSNNNMIIDWNNGTKQAISLNGDYNIIFNSHPVGPTNLLLKIKQDSTGSHSILSWSATDKSILWASGNVPSLTATANGIDIVSVYYDGSNYYAAATIGFA